MKNNEKVTMVVGLNDLVQADINVHKKLNKPDEALKALANSIKSMGLLQRIACYKREDGKYEIIDGHRRYEACKLAGMKEVPIEVFPVDKDAAMSIMLTINALRIDNDPLLEAKLIEDMVNRGKSFEEIAAIRGKDVSYVRRRARLINLTKDWVKFFETHKVTIDFMENVAAHSKELQTEVYENDMDQNDHENLDEVLVWDDFDFYFNNRMYKISKANFDTKVCAKCCQNTACEGYLFPEFNNKDSAMCQNSGCYKRRQNDAILKKMDALKKKGDSAIEVSEKWKVPNSWSSTDKKTDKNNQAYVYEDDTGKHMVWSVKNEPNKPQKSAEELKEERKVKKEQKRIQGLISGFRSKVIDAVTKNDELRERVFREFIDTDVGMESVIKYLTERFSYAFGYEGCTMVNELDGILGADSIIMKFNVPVSDEERNAWVNRDPKV